MKLGVNTTKEVKNLYIENYEVQLNVIEKDTNKWKNVLCSLIGRIDIVNMSIPKNQNGIASAKRLWNQTEI